MSIQLFRVASIRLGQQQEDPFGFDAYSEKVAGKYVPFSGTIRKPIYLLFVAYVEWLIKHKLNLTSRREKDAAKIRLEKLLVLNWKRNETAGRGQAIIGNSIREINPFRGNDGNWVVQNCFKIYGSSTWLVPHEVLEKYHRQHYDEFLLLREFLLREGLLDTHKVYLHNLLKKLKRRRGGIYSGKLLLAPQYAKPLFKQLQKEIEKTRWTPVFLYNKLFYKPSQAHVYLERALEGQPFNLVNNWFSSFVAAVSSDIDEAPTAAGLWRKADAAYVALKPAEFSRRPKPKCWLKYDGQRYIKQEDFDLKGWEALVRRGTTYSAFRTPALASLLKELDSSLHLKT